jgi:UDP-4-amino-4,6-dideoxy-N-acetyl-beta-L-altrosamine transaminase
MTISYGRQDVTAADVEAVTAVLRSDWLTQGPAVPRFEQALASRCGAAHAFAVNSGTSALHLACLALGLGPGDTLWTSPNTFVASANCALYCGAEVDFVDIDPRTYNMSVEALQAKLHDAEARGKLPKILVPVHFAGQSCDMPAIHALAERYRFRIIEDASHAIGGRWRGEPVGSCRWSDIAVLSFHPVKIITTAEGGACLTNDRELATRIATMRTHGITRDPRAMTRRPDGDWYYEQIDLGFNYRMTDVQAALGVSQLERLDDYVARRNLLAVRYDRALLRLPMNTPWRHPDALSAFHLYVIRLRNATADRRAVYERLHAQGITLNVHYIPVHLQPYYQRRGFRDGVFPEAERHYREALTLPLYPTLPEADQDRVVTALHEALEES